MLACPGNRAYCYRELAVSYIAVSVTIAVLFVTEGWLGWVYLGDWLNIKTVYP